MGYINKINCRRGKPDDRRGVLLLVVLSLLVLFALITMTFVMVARQYRSNSRSEGKNENRASDPRKLLDEAALQVLRDTRNTKSVLQKHSLLEDEFGSNQYEGFRAQVVASTEPDPNPPGGNITYPEYVSKTGKQFIQFQVGSPSSALATADGFYNGCVLTVLSGALAGESTRIVGYRGTPPTLQVMAFDGKSSLPKAGDQILVNGRPFNGTGFGFKPSSGLIDAVAQKVPQNAIDDPLSKYATVDLPFALLPNPAYFVANASEGYNEFGGVGGADEDYDAPDFQNMLLAYVPPRAALATDIIPSLHRPDLIKYWEKKGTNAASWAEISPYLLNRIMMRPSPLMHYVDVDNNGTYTLGVDPDFTGKVFDANSRNPILGPWDIDNDGDGVADSVWVDLGQPVTATPDGRLLKPLFAIMCVDLDSRLNLNAHGNWAQTDAPQDFGDVVAGGTLPPTTVLPPGEGYGPAEINISAFFDNTTTPAGYEVFLSGSATVDSRYGEGPLVTAGTKPMPGVTGFEQPLTPIKYGQFPNPPSRAVMPNQSSFGRYPNLWGRRPVVLDWRGVPALPVLPAGDTIDTVVSKETLNNPYEINLSRKAVRASKDTNAPDNPFTVAELERILRPYDIDTSSLPVRLTKVLGNSLASAAQPYARRLFTTDSWAVPVPAMLAPVAKRTGATPSPNHILSRYPSLTMAQLGQMLPPELMAGLRFDINRAFGNGRDDNPPMTGLGTVDEPSESQLPEKAWTQGPNASFTNSDFWHTNGIDANGDGTLDQTDNLLARQLYARYLYCLMMLLKDVGDINYDFNGNGVPAESGETERAIAQWAINVVDFRDVDSIMTPFEYDTNLSDGWDAAAGDGDLTTAPTSGGVVWGCERPELLITETLAWHDRRTEDLMTPDGKVPANKAPPMTGDDDDFDQRLAPRGRFFVELYNPWPVGESPMAELHAADSSGRFGVQLDKKAPDGHSVWRLLIANDSTTDKDPDSTIASERLPVGDIDRTVYFAEPPTPSLGDFYIDPGDNDAKKIAPILPGRYGVVGSGVKRNESNGVLNYVSTVGRATTANEGAIASLFDNTRAIRMSPDAEADQSDVVVRDNNAGNNPDVASGVGKKPTVAIVVNFPRPLNISEPKSGYAGATLNGAGDEVYPGPIDKPVDDDPKLTTNGVYLGYKTVYLQRLANPLLAWNAQTNPYRTIDVASVDLTSFNGVADDKDDPIANPGPAGADLDNGIGTWQRGEQAGQATAPPVLWRTELPHPGPIVKVNGVGGHWFNYRLVHTLGGLNSPHEPWKSMDTMTGTPPMEYLGDPKTAPFPWMTWNNRLFANVGELLLVPYASSFRLLGRYSFAGTADPYATPDPQFQHLLNIFNYSESGKFHRLLEYVEVPSRYFGSEIYLEPGTFNVASKDESAFWRFFHPPFNRIRNYRDPGLININTISDPEVWKAILDGHYGLLFDQLVKSRRGDNAALPQTTPSATLPSAFGNPFRSFVGAELTESLMKKVNPASPDIEDVQVTLLRPDPDNQSVPLFANPVNLPTAANYNNPDRNPYFRYETLQRLSSMVTTRSNVYAVWITVGYFEVDANGRLRQEVGADTGEIARHRAFYIFDRTIPVGYERGVDHNVEKAILLRRFIE